ALATVKPPIPPPSIATELVDILKEPLEKSGILYYSHNMTNIKQDKDGVAISFDNEKQQKTVQVDMVIGADGIHSTVVKQIFTQTAHIHCPLLPARKVINPP
ncbi:unnamed protein product, partial [Rotaria sordida]